jgi:hypothetical protein
VKETDQVVTETVERLAADAFPQPPYVQDRDLVEVETSRLRQFLQDLDPAWTVEQITASRIADGSASVQPGPVTVGTVRHHSLPVLAYLVVLSRVG